MDLGPATAQRYLSHAFDQMLAVADRLGDERVNVRPHGPATNTVAGLIVHCCGVSDFWMGHVALGERSERSRDDEFARTATVAELHALVEATLERAADQLARLEAGGGTDEGGRQFLLEGDDSDASVVVHVLEELYQHPRPHGPDGGRPRRPGAALRLAREPGLEPVELQHQRHAGQQHHGADEVGDHERRCQSGDDGPPRRRDGARRTSGAGRLHYGPPTDCMSSMRLPNGSST